MFRSLVLLLLCGLTGPGYTQVAGPAAAPASPATYQIPTTQVSEPVEIDGQLTEAVWQTAPVAADFRMHLPVDDKPATQATEVRLAFDDRFLYVAAMCYDTNGYVIQTLKRDDFGDSDAFAVLLDPVGQQATGFGFGVNAENAQTEVLIVGGDADPSWDNKWYSAVQQTPEGFVVEMAIPFKTLRFKSQSPTWRVNFWRIDPGANEESTWVPVPRQFEGIDIGYYGTLNWPQLPANPGTNISLIPYSTGNYNRNADADTEKVDWDLGGDAKVAITPSLNLDLTFNPDFSQVEVDQQVTNLTRFNIFFPERRNFFLENADIFSSFGVGAESPFYSRTIGLDDAGRAVPLTYGVRLSGNVTENWRMGAFNIHSGGNDVRLGQNYTALAFQRRLWARSELKGLFLNRQAFHDGEMQDRDYGRNLGGEFNYVTTDGKWRAGAGYIHSYKAGFDTKNDHVYGRFSYDGTRFRTFLNVQHLGENYFSDLGFTGRLINFDPERGELVRVGFTEFANMVDYYTYPENSRKVNFHWSGVENFVYLNTDGTLNEWYTRVRHFIFYKNTSQLRFRFNNNYVDLLYPFALTETPLPAKVYHMQEFNVQFNTDVRRRLTTSMFVVYGDFYGGNKLTVRGDVTLRAQPWGNFTLGFDHNNIRLPEPYGDLTLNLVNARVELNFATNLFWTTFLQYNTQADNFNVNSRLQWRFAPMSDVFLVYTDNYRVEGLFGPKDRSLVLKVNYWFTI